MNPFSLLFLWKHKENTMVKVMKVKTKTMVEERIRKSKILTQDIAFIRFSRNFFVLSEANHFARTQVTQLAGALTRIIEEAESQSEKIRKNHVKRMTKVQKSLQRNGKEVKAQGRMKKSMSTYTSLCKDNVNLFPRILDQRGAPRKTRLKRNLTPQVKSPSKRSLKKSSAQFRARPILHIKKPLFELSLVDKYLSWHFIVYCACNSMIRKVFLGCALGCIIF